MTVLLVVPALASFGPLFFGFKPGDITLMLISHAHYDHMETMETIRRITVAALEAEVPALVSGHDLSSNETWGAEPLQVGRVLESGDDITFDSYKALRAMNPDILITGHPQNLLKDKLDALWANKRPSPLALAPGQWKKTVDDSAAATR